jgi:phosphatidylglycerophosphate synthase
MPLFLALAGTRTAQMAELRRHYDGPLTAAAEASRALRRGLRPPYGEALAVFAVAGLAVMAVVVALPLSGPRPIVAAGMLYLLAAAVALARMGNYPKPHFGIANGVTVVRLAGAAIFAGFAVEPAILAGSAAWWALAAALALLSLDGVDGFFARWQKLESDYGARFDMEVDALFILVLAFIAYNLGETGLWVLGLGLLRYAFVVAAWAWPILDRPLPWSRRRKTVCVIQVAVLTALLAPVVVPPVSGWLAAAAFAALVWSFAVDIRWLLAQPPDPR